MQPGNGSTPSGEKVDKSLITRFAQPLRDGLKKKDVRLETVKRMLRRRSNGVSGAEGC